MNKCVKGCRYKEDKEIKIGDTVEIIDDGKMYSSAENFCMIQILTFI